MNLNIVFLILSCVMARVASVNLSDKFNDWLQRFEIDINNYHGKSPKDIFNSWVANEKAIIENNFLNTSLTLGHNKFSGLNSDEFSKYMGFRKVERITQPILSTIDSSTIDPSTFPESLDWREKGAVTKVKSQGQCGSCWAFSTVGALEGAYQIKYGDLKEFSEQQLVSCDTRKNGVDKDLANLGCNGGMMDTAFDYIGVNDGLCSEEDYPYTSGDTKETGDCVKTCKADVLSDVQSHVDVEPNSDEAMMAALMVGPVSVAIQANQMKFQLYHSGVLKGSECGDDLDHGVLVVGWGTENGTPYWIVKNSWDTTWGNGGYIYLERGTNANGGTGTCGILSIPSYPVL